MPGHSHRVGPEYDPEVARELLAEAGYPEGRPPELKMLVPPWLMLTAKLIAEQVAEIGSASTIARPTGSSGRRASRTSTSLSGFGADYPDPDGFFRGLFREPFPFYRDDEIEEKIIEAGHSATSPSG